MSGYAHDGYVFSYTAAGQRYHRAECKSCPWHGVATGDRDRATAEAADHGGAS